MGYQLNGRAEKISERKGINIATHMTPLSFSLLAVRVLLLLIMLLLLFQ